MLSPPDPHDRGRSEFVRDLAAVAPALDAPDSRAPESTREQDRVRVRDRVGVTSLETFDVYRVSLDACRACAPIAATLTAILKDQLLRASSSRDPAGFTPDGSWGLGAKHTGVLCCGPQLMKVLNIAEGFGSSSRGVKRRHYEIARGSAVECIAVLDLASALGVVDGSATGLATARTLFTRVAMMLSKLETRFR